MIQPFLPHSYHPHPVSDRTSVSEGGTGHMHTHIALFYFIAKKSLGPFFPALPLLMHVPYSVTSLLHSWPCNMLATPAWAMAIPFRGSSLLCWFRCASFQPIQFLLIHSSLGYGTSVPTPRSLGISHSPFIYFAFVSAYISCVDFEFESVISRRAMAFTTAPFTCWLRHQAHIRGSFAIPYFFGCRLLRALFGYAEIVFSAVGLSELFAHLLAVLFRASVTFASIITPRWSFASHSLPPFLREQLRLIKFLGENLSPICHLVALGSIGLGWQ